MTGSEAARCDIAASTTELACTGALSSLGANGHIDYPEIAVRVHQAEFTQPIPQGFNLLHYVHLKTRFADAFLQAVEVVHRQEEVNTITPNRALLQAFSHILP